MFQSKLKIVFLLVAIYLLNFNLIAQEKWTQKVRIGGYPLSIEKVDSIIANAQFSNVFGIETDNDITGRYDSFLDPTEKLEAIKKVTEAAHAVGNRTFVYIAGLECITENADQKNYSFYKDHPDWVQRDINGRPAIFDSDDAFWIDEGEEDVWISPYAKEWRKIYMQRVREIAATGIDGIYVDIPYWMTHFDGWTDTWASYDDYTVQAFKDETGIDAKTEIDLGNYDDLNFIKWIDFRMKTLTEFMKEIDENVKGVNPKAKTIAEIYPGLGSDAVVVGADVYQMYEVVDAIAHEYSEGEYYASDRAPLDWYKYMIGMHTFRAFAGDKATWMLSYSWYDNENVKPAEAMKSMFVSQLFAGTNSWDTEGYIMSSSNDIDTRTEVYKWIEKHEDHFYSKRKPFNPIGVYFSPVTRNFYPEEFIESYWGITQLLINNHFEFEIVTPRSLANFKGTILILDNVKKISEDEQSEFKKLSTDGVKFILSGETQELNLDDSILLKESPGKEYNALLTEELNDCFNGKSEAEKTKKYKSRFKELLDSLTENANGIRIKAPIEIFASTSLVNGKPYIYLTNMSGICESCGDNKINISNVIIELDKSLNYSKIYSLPFMGEVTELTIEQKEGRMICKIPTINRGTVIWLE